MAFFSCCLQLQAQKAVRAAGRKKGNDEDGDDEDRDYKDNQSDEDKAAGGNRHSRGRGRARGRGRGRGRKPADPAEKKIDKKDKKDVAEDEPEIRGKKREHSERSKVLKRPGAKVQPSRSDAPSSLSPQDEKAG